ncbi:MAG TPA: hypothetical protein VJ921_08595 [Vicinamibacteria bacterium]|nr:hypothetical protein [Vicinamibacteria bacterium]
MTTHDVDAVEIKVTIRPDQELQALRQLKLDEDSAEVRVIYFYDTVALDLYNAGLALRARLVKGDADDSTVKRRPIEPGKIPARWRDVDGFKLEADAVGRKVVVSASLTSCQKRDEIDEVAEGKRPIEKLFSKNQQRFIEELHPTPVDLATLKVLGPIRVLRWKTSHKKFPYDLCSEEWRLPDGTDLLEVSIKVGPDGAEESGPLFATHLSEMGLDPGGAQETKTRTALEFFAHQKR